jgi:UDPglucose--hexose-1-phosphate uridylyltransferase
MTATEFRTDPITGRVAILVPGRSARPNDHAVAPPTAPTDANCPFCEGNEGTTPAEVAVFAPPGRPPNSRGWYVRTIPNRFPTVASDTPPSQEVSSGGALSRSPAFGFHEVVIESPSHAPSLAFLPAEQVVRVVRMCRDRVRYLSGQPHVGSITLFENTGPESGGSLWHPHAQLVSVPGWSPSLREEIEGAERYRKRWGGRCAFEAVVREELKDGTRKLFDSDGFVGYAPFASLVPHEVRVVPTRHAPSLGGMTDDEAAALAGHLAALLRALLSVLPGASYNFVVRSPVPSGSPSESYHWHLDLVPRLIRPDGFDLGSGYSVNTVLPEVAAEALREALAAKR